MGTKPNISHQIYWTKFTKPYIQNCIHKIPSTNQNVWNVKNLIYWTKHTKPNLFNPTWKPENQFYQTKFREYTENLSEVQFQLVLSLAQLSPSVFLWFLERTISLYELLCQQQKKWNTAEKSNFWKIVNKIRFSKKSAMDIFRASYKKIQILFLSKIILHRYCKSEMINNKEEPP